MTTPPVRVVSPAELRGMFNEHNFWARAQRGELTQKLIDESHVSSPRSGLPVCTWSQIIAYFDDKGTKVALVHQYLRPDGKLGVSGRPDPKHLLLEGLLYIVV